MSATTTPLLSSGKFCRLRYDTISVKMHLQMFLSITITKKFQILSCDTLVANERSVLQQCFPDLFACSPLLLSKNNHGFSHPCSRKYSVQMKVIQNYKLTSQNTSRSPNNALDDLTLIKITVAHFVCTGSFLMIYSNSRTKKHTSN